MWKRFLILIFSFVILTRFQIDPDLGWHLAMGNHFLKSGEIISFDQFSWTMPAHEWEISYLGYEIFIAYLFLHLKFYLIVIFFGLLASLSVALLIDRKVDYPKLFVICFGVGLLTVSLGIRPHTFSFLFFVILLKFLESKVYLKKIYAFLWFLLFAVWVNLHQGFIVGLFIFALYLTIDFLWPKTRKRFDIKSVSISFFAAVCGTLVNPYLFGLWMTITRDSAFVNTWMTIAEFQPIVLHSPANIFFAVTGMIFIYIFFRKMKDIEPHFLLTGCFLFAMAFVASFMVPFWVAIFLFITSRYFEFNLKLKFDRVSRAYIYFALAVFTITVSLNFFLELLESYKLERRLVIDQYPQVALRYLQENKLSGGIFNEYGWGGFIDWQMPEAKVFIDGRMASWRFPGEKGILNDYLDIYSGKCETVRKYDIRTVLVKKDLKVDCFSDFVEVYRDDIAKILVKSN